MQSEEIHSAFDYDAGPKLPELANSRFPEYKELGANSSTGPLDQVATSCSLHAALF